MASDPIIPKSKTDAPTQTSASADIAAFVAKAKAMAPNAAGGRGRLVFALDATMSRQPTWDMACALQADMFHEAASIGSLDIRLVYFRGLSECRATGWISAMAAGASAQRVSTIGNAPALPSTSIASAAECSATTTIGPKSVI